MTTVQAIISSHPLSLMFWKELIYTGFTNGSPEQIKGQKNGLDAEL